VNVAFVKKHAMIVKKQCLERCFTNSKPYETKDKALPREGLYLCTVKFRIETYNLF